MIIKSSADRWVSVACLFACDLCALWLFLSMEIGLVTPIVLFIYCLQATFYDWISSCRVLIMTEQGCTVRFLWISRFYAWSDLKMKRCIDYTNHFRTHVYKAIVVFSPVERSIPKWMFADEYCQLVRPFSCFFVTFKSERAISKWARVQPDLYVVNERDFRKKMMEWGVVLTKE